MGNRTARQPRALACVASAALALTFLATPTHSQPAVSASGDAFSIALIGDAPYGAQQAADFPTLATAINSDPEVRLVLHSGDIKTGDEPCGEAALAERFAVFSSFQKPFVFTPGDNDWTDCHRNAAGGHVPTEQLEILRRIAYPRAGQASGAHPMAVTSQPTVHPEHAAYVENATWFRSTVQFATIHVVGSTDDRQPWGLREQTTVRMAEYQARRAADLAWIDEAFAAAVRNEARGVLILMQADPFVSGTTVVSPSFREITDRIVGHARAFGGPVVLAHGDTHEYKLDRPFADAPNVIRVENFGEVITDWVKITVDPRAAELFSFSTLSTISAQ